MASPGGNSAGSGSSLLQNSGSEEDLQVVMVVDERKRKRMQSNRESARRSRLRKQKHLDDLMSQVGQLRKDNNQILSSINVTTQHLLNVEAENSILRAQIVELGQRLDSLNDILNFINTSNGIYDADLHNQDLQTSADSFMINPLNLICLNQPIMASPDLFQY